MAYSETVAVKIMVSTSISGAGFGREISGMQRDAVNAAKGVREAFSNNLAVTFFGNLAASIADQFLRQFQRIPEFVRQYLGEAVAEAERRINSLKGLESTAVFKGVDSQAAQEAVKNLRLVKAGVVDVASASNALKNLLQVNFDLKQSVALLERFSDTAAFGKQQTLTYSRALESVGEALKNNNPLLLDNAGMSKNLSVIMKEMGHSTEAAGLLSTDAGIRLAAFNGIMKETAGQVGDADKLVEGYTGTVSALTLAKMDLKAAIGEIIIQNPELIALLKLWTQHLQDVTGALKEQDSQQRITFANFISGLSLSAVKVQNWGELTVAVFSDVFRGFKWIASTFAGYMDYGMNKILTSFRATLDDIKSLGNEFISGANKIGGLVGLTPVELMPIGNGREQFYENERKFKELNEARTKYFEVEKGFWRDSRKAIIDGADRLTEFRYLAEEARRKMLEATEGSGVRRSGAPDSTTGSGAGKANRLSEAGLTPFARDRDVASFSRAMRNLSPALKQQITRYAEQYGIPQSLAMAQIFSESSFNPTAVSPFNKNVGQSAYGLTQVLPSTATSVLGRRTKGADLFNTDTALTAWGKYMTSLFEEFGDWEMAAFAYHNGEGAARKFARALDSGNNRRIAQFAKSNPKGVAYARKISALSGLSKEEQFGIVDTKKLSDELTEKAAYERALRGLGVFDRIGVNQLPRSIIDPLFKRTIKEAEAAGTAKPSRNEFVAQLLADRERKLPAPTETVESRGTISTAISPQLTPYQEFIERRKEDLGISQKIEEIELRRATFAEGVALRIQSEIHDQTLDLLKVQEDQAVLERQAADARFSARRRDLVAAGELNSLTRERIALEDDIANFGRNQNERLINEALRDRLDILRQEEDAVASINRSQLQLAQQTVYSSNQANAKVLEFLASQKSVTEAVADFRIGLVQGGYDLIDKGLDRIIPKLGAVGDALKSMLSSFLKLAVNTAFRRLFGLDGGVAGSSGGGGWRGVLGGILGMGGTPPFNGGNFASGGGASTGSGAYAGGAPAGGALGALGQNAAGISGLTGMIEDGVHSAPRTMGSLPAAIAQATNSGRASGSAGGLGKLSGFLNSPMFAGALLGGGIGAQLGRGSVAGTIAGGVGVGLMGLVGGAIAPSIMAGTFAGLTLLGGATLGIGAGLAVLGYFLGRSARRKKEKKEVTTASGDAVRKIQMLIADVKAFKIDGATAYAQGQALRDSFKESIAGLKTKPGKKLAQEKLQQMDSLLATLKTEADRSDRQHQIADIIDERLVPTFHSGGHQFTGTSYGERYARLKSNEVVLSHQNINALGGYRALQNAGVRGINMTNESGGYVPRMPASQASNSGQNMYIVGVFDESTADEIMDKVSPLGMAKKVRFAAKNRLGGMVDAIGDSLAE